MPDVEKTENEPRTPTIIEGGEWTEFPDKKGDFLGLYLLKEDERTGIENTRKHTLYFLHKNENIIKDVKIVRSHSLLGVSMETKSPELLKGRLIETEGESPKLEIQPS